ncbi:MAG: hypothetical protein C3F13_01815 [Anaerolineales bacterium]|nr:hypothetical protein [Anaerolineae bacterium]PWB56299.1 MAG: hypothetical protein C3F13_01815 [Anaerolineales bacterium]
MLQPVKKASFAMTTGRADDHTGKNTSFAMTFKAADCFAIIYNNKQLTSLQPESVEYLLEGFKLFS